MKIRLNSKFKKKISFIYIYIYLSDCEKSKENCKEKKNKEEEWAEYSSNGCCSMLPMENNIGRPYWSRQSREQ